MEELFGKANVRPGESVADTALRDAGFSDEVPVPWSEKLPPQSSSLSSSSSPTPSPSTVVHGVATKMLTSIKTAVIGDNTVVDFANQNVRLDVFSHVSFLERYVHAIHVSAETPAPPPAGGGEEKRKLHGKQPVVTEYTVGSPQYFYDVTEGEGDKKKTVTHYVDFGSNHGAVFAGKDSGSYITAIRGRTSKRHGDRDTLERIQFETTDEDGVTTKHKKCGGRGGEKFEIVAPPNKYLSKVRIGTYRVPGKNVSYVSGLHDLEWSDLPAEVVAAQKQQRQRPVTRTIDSIQSSRIGPALEWLGLGSHEISLIRRFVRHEAASEEIQDAQIAVLGLLLIGFAIACINMNERRAVRQDMLNEFCEDELVSPHLHGDEKLRREDFSDQPLHAHGDLHPKPTAPTDALCVRLYGKLRGRRVVEMYQWVEQRHEQVSRDKKGNVTSRRVYYTYSQQWRSSYERVSHDVSKINPPFPVLPGSNDFEPERIEMHVHNHDELHFRISNNFITRWLTDFTAVNSTITTTDDEQTARKFKLRVAGERLYSIDGSNSSPKLGDVRVEYTGVNDGAFTAIGKYRSDDVGIEAFVAKMTDTLAEQAQLAMPWNRKLEVGDEAGGVAGKILARRRFLNTTMIEKAADVQASTAESWVLRIRPLEFARLWRGNKTKKEACELFQHECDNTTLRIFLSSAAIMATGVLLADPATCFETIAFGCSGTTAVGCIPLAMIGRWRAQKVALSVKQRALRRDTSGSGSGSGSADVVFDGSQVGAAARSRAKHAELPTEGVRQRVREMATDQAKKGVVAAVRAFFKK